VESIAKWPVAAIPFLLLEARAYLEGVGKVVPDMKCQSIAAGATPRHCLARGPLTDRTKTVPDTGENTAIPLDAQFREEDVDGYLSVSRLDPNRGVTCCS
jgi:hypothetical protein